MSASSSTALSDPRMAPLCASMGCDVVLMHMRGQPGTMQRNTSYDDVVAEVLPDQKAAVVADLQKRGVLGGDDVIAFGVDLVNLVLPARDLAAQDKTGFRVERVVFP